MEHRILRTATRNPALVAKRIGSRLSSWMKPHMANPELRKSATVWSVLILSYFIPIALAPAQRESTKAAPAVTVSSPTNNQYRQTIVSSVKGLSKSTVNACKSNLPSYYEKCSRKASTLLDEIGDLAKQELSQGFNWLESTLALAEQDLTKVIPLGENVLLRSDEAFFGGRNRYVIDRHKDKDEDSNQSWLFQL